MKGSGVYASTLHFSDSSAVPGVPSTARGCLANQACIRSCLMVPGRVTRGSGGDFCVLP